MSAPVFPSSSGSDSLRHCRFCGLPPGTKVGPPALARCITPDCEGAKLGAETIGDWNFLNAPQAQAGETKSGNVCCYCDATLSCASCGREQPNDAGGVAQAEKDPQTAFNLGFRAAGGGCHLPPSAEALFQSWLRDGFAVSSGREREEEIPAASPPAALPAGEALFAFFKWAMQEGPWEGDDLWGGDVQDKAESLGLVVKTKYDPDKHGDHPDFAKGADFYEIAPGVALPSTEGNSRG